MTSARDQFVEDRDADGNPTFRCKQCGRTFTFARTVLDDVAWKAKQKLGIGEPFAGWGPIADLLNEAARAAVDGFQGGPLEHHLRWHEADETMRAILRAADNHPPGKPHDATKHATAVGQLLFDGFVAVLPAIEASAADIVVRFPQHGRDLVFRLTNAGALAARENAENQTQKEKGIQQ